jgi:hypothetical protein
MPSGSCLEPGSKRTVPFNTVSRRPGAAASKQGAAKWTAHTRDFIRGRVKNSESVSGRHGQMIGEEAKRTRGEEERERTALPGPKNGLLARTRDQKRRGRRQL